MVIDLADGQRIPPRALAIGLAGAAPFWVLAGLSLGLSGRVTPALAVSAVVAYGAVTLAFLGGVRWGLAIGPYGAGRRDREFALSGLAPLAGFVAMFLPSAVGVSVLVAALLLQATWDSASADLGRLPPWFAKLRAILTALAVAPLLAVLGRSLLAAQS
jgi:hypothetical protein